MSVQRQLVSAQNNKPAMGLVQDALVAMYLLTSRDMFIDRADMCDFLMWIHYPMDGKAQLPMPCILKPRPLWSGKQLFSCLLPSTFDFTKRTGDVEGSDPMDNSERWINVNAGELLSGRLTKETLGTSSMGFVHLFVREYGKAFTCRWLSDAQRVANGFLSRQGFSVGMSDCWEPSSHVRASVKRVIDSSREKMIRLHHEVVDNEGYSVADVEPAVRKIAQSALSRVGGKIDWWLHHSPASAPGESAPSKPNTNRLSAMIIAGSKGNQINLAQIRGAVGQQSLEGKRLQDHTEAPTKQIGRLVGRIQNKPGVAVRVKTGTSLPCFHPDDMSPEAHGFVEESYVDGLSPHNFYMHMMAGREGLVDTAVKVMRRLPHLCDFGLF